MNDLHRELAPVSAEAWEQIEAEAVRVAKVNLAARRLVDFSGPFGWGHDAVALGRVEPVSDTPAAGVEGALRRVQPLGELRAPFELNRAELDAIDRGARDPDLRPLVEACERISRAEDHAVFHGWPAAGISGLFDASPHAALRISADYVRYPQTVVEAIGRLQDAGVAGPYAIALGPRCWAGLMTAADPSGRPVLTRLQKLLDGPIVRASAVDGAAVLSLRGGDFELTVGRDLSIGYESHTRDRVRLYFVESFTFRALAPEAAVPLRYGD